MEEKGRLKFSTSQVRQGSHRFFTLTMPIDVLSKTCFVTRRDEDPQQGFQRVLDKARAEQIAAYIDSGFGTIPNSIVLSAQPEADFKVVGGGKTISFKPAKKAFLILDGQHRVYGFSLATKEMRVPVVIYNGLSRQDETRLFIDINTKQRPVPNELLLDIKKLAEYENDTEKLLREVFDYFDNENDSPLLGLMSPAARSEGKLSRVTFNAAVKPIIPKFGSASSFEIYAALKAFIAAFTDGLREFGLELNITNSTMFRAMMLLFPDVASRVKDRFSSNYTVENFSEIMTPMFSQTKKGVLKKPGSSYKLLHEALLKALQTGFIL